MFVMPETMSIERRKLLLGYGAEIVLTDGKKGMAGAIEKAAEMEKELENAIVLGQFVNKANPEAHYRTTGPEIWEDTEGKIDLFIAGVGTGGTITGTGKYLKEKNPGIRVIAVEPYGSPVLSGGKPGPHGLQGIGAGFVPEVLDTDIYDEICTVKDEDAYKAARMLAQERGGSDGYYFRRCTAHRTAGSGKRRECRKSDHSASPGYWREVSFDAVICLKTIKVN